VVVGKPRVFFAENKAKAIGIDISENQLKFAKSLASKKNLEVSFIRREMTDLSIFRNNSFDLANSSHAIHYIRNPQKCFDEIFRVLKKGGKFVFSVSHPLNHITEIEDNKLVVKRSYFKKQNIDGIGR
jgi:ubiquinone/menaquinone biosynthesis C-methylase UbiE